MKKRRVLALMMAMTMAAGTLLTGNAAQAAEEPVELDLFIDFTWWTVDEWSGIIPDELTANGGVKFNLIKAGDDNQLGLMIASGELPDLIFTDTQALRMCDPNLCYSYDELIEKYNIDWQPNEEKIAIAKTYNVDPEDPHYYMLKQNYNTKEEWSKAAINHPNVSGTLIRQDILDALGNPPMDTLEDYVKVLEMVKEQYPDMVPYNAGDPNMRFGDFQLYYDLRGNYGYESDGSVAYRYTSERFYEYCKFVNSLYRKGLFELEDLGITNGADAEQQVASGRSFSWPGMARPTTINNYFGSMLSGIDGAEVGIMSIPDDAEDEISYASVGWAGLFISKNCKDPEAAIKMVAYLNSKEGQDLSMWGREGIDYTLDEDGIPQFSEDWIETLNTSDKLMVEKYNYQILTTTELHETLTYYGGVEETLKEKLLKNCDRFRYTPELALVEPVKTSDAGIVQQKIEDAAGSELVKIYTAEDDETFDKEYENFQNLMKDMGVDQLNEYAAAHIDEYKAEFGN